jgi:hypothetical protein
LTAFASEDQFSEEWVDNKELTRKLGKIPSEFDVHIQKRAALLALDSEYIDVGVYLRLIYVPKYRSH